MPNWAKIVASLAIVAVILAIAWQIFGGAGGSIEVLGSKIKVDQRVPNKPTPSGPRECRLPQHGIEYWKHTETWTADSGWRGGGSSDEQFCGAAKLGREKKYPDRKVFLISKHGAHRVVYNPFKHDEYQYTCIFEDRWEPVYKLAADDACPP
jgi:hypothetical protein